MRLIFLLITAFGLRAETQPEDTTKCAIPENRLATADYQDGHISFYSCAGKTINKAQRPVDAVIIWKEDGPDRGMVYVGITKTEIDARRLKEKLQRDFISRTSGQFAKYLELYRKCAKLPATHNDLLPGFRMHSTRGFQLGMRTQKPSGNRLSSE